MILPFLMFFLASLTFVPIAWLIGISDKFKILLSPYGFFKKKMLNVGVFIFLGPAILVLDTCTDVFYFWKNNFRDDLEKIIITEEIS